MTDKEKAEEFRKNKYGYLMSNAMKEIVENSFIGGLAEGERIGKEKQWIATEKAQKKTSAKIKDLEKENTRLSKMLNIAIMDRCLWTSDGDIQKETTEYRAELERRVVKMLEA